MSEIMTPIHQHLPQRTTSDEVRKCAWRQTCTKDVFKDFSLINNALVYNEISHIYLLKIALQS